LGSNEHGKSGSGGQLSGLLQAPWVSTVIANSCHSSITCLKSRYPNQKATLCPKYPRGGNSPQ
jgi:hypothetical protein